VTLHGSNTSLASADQTLSGSETEDLGTPQTSQVITPWGSAAFRGLCDSQP